MGIPPEFDFGVFRTADLFGRSIFCALSVLPLGWGQVYPHPLPESPLEPPLESGLDPPFDFPLESPLYPHIESPLGPPPESPLKPSVESSLELGSSWDWVFLPPSLQCSSHPLVSLGS